MLNKGKGFSQCPGQKEQSSGTLPGRPRRNRREGPCRAWAGGAARETQQGAPTWPNSPSLMLLSTRVPQTQQAIAKAEPSVHLPLLTPDFTCVGRWWTQSPAPQPPPLLGVWGWSPVADPGLAGDGGWAGPRREGRPSAPHADQSAGGTGSAPPRAAPSRPARAPGRWRQQRRHQQLRQHTRAASGGAGRTDRQTEGAGGARPSWSGHGGSLVRRGPRGGRPGPRELRAAAPDPTAGRVLGVLHRRLRAHHQRGLREHRQRARAALRLQRERGRLPLRSRPRPRGFSCLRRLPAARLALPADQQRTRPAPRGAARPGLLRAVVLPVVRGLLLPHQPVAAHGARARHAAGRRRGEGRHRLQLLLHPQLGGAHGEGPAAVPPGHGHVALCHRTAGRRGGSGLPWLPGGQRRGGHRDLPEPSLHRDPGHQPQRVPGACLLVAGRPPPGLEGCPQARVQGFLRPPSGPPGLAPGTERVANSCGPSGAQRG